MSTPTVIPPQSPASPGSEAFELAPRVGRRERSGLVGVGGVRPLAPRGGNDRVMTPPAVARQIIRHFRPHGRILDPCRGAGAFWQMMPTQCDWFEIDEGRDFLASGTEQHWDWIVTNPPWSKFREFLRHSMEVADNVVFLCLVNAWFMKARQRDIAEAEFGLVEILHVETPPKPWPQAGFSLGAAWLRREWTGGIHFSAGGGGAEPVTNTPRTDSGAKPLNGRLTGGGEAQ